MLQINQNTSPNERPTGEEQHRAYRLIIDMLQIEKTLIAYEAFALTHQDVRQRIGELFVLDAWYRKNFGVAFRQRHEFRKQLICILNEKTRSISDAQRAAEFERAGLSETAADNCNPPPYD